MIIGISGKLGTGKTTVTNMLINSILPSFGMSGVRMAFGDKLKSMASEVYGFDRELCYTGKTSKVKIPENIDPALVNPKWDNEPTVREILQYYGTDYTRAKDADFWVKELSKDVEKAAADFVIIDDVRFPNEYDFAMKNGICVRIEAYPGYGRGGDHSSETALDRHSFSMKFFPAFGEKELEKVTAGITELLCDMNVLARQDAGMKR